MFETLDGYLLPLPSGGPVLPSGFGPDDLPPEGGFIALLPDG